MVQNGKLVLASASPRREELLRRLGLTFTVMPSQVDEAFITGETPQNHVLRLSAEKAASVAAVNGDAWVLGADTIVLIDGEVLGKPTGYDEALGMLRKLSGRTHEVFTGFTITNPGRRTTISRWVRSLVTFRNITPDEAAWYASSPEPYDKAGAYAVQGRGAFFIKEIHGSYTNVMGLPLCEVVDALKETGVLSFT
ncbi:MAG: Maf family protein [Syntrophales bacterium]|nr:Maf family protein [Syntrophales bacterium]